MKLRNLRNLVFHMSADAIKTMILAVVLILPGLAAFYGGTKWLGLLIPAAALIWYGVRPRLRSGRN